MNKRSEFLILSLFSTVGIFLANHSFAYLLGNYATNSGISVNGMVRTIETLIWVIFGAIVVVCFVLAGIMFLTAQGEPEKIKTARNAVVWGIVGIVVGILAYSILYIVSRFL